MGICRCSQSHNQVLKHNTILLTGSRSDQIITPAMTTSIMVAMEMATLTAPERGMTTPSGFTEVTSSLVRKAVTGELALSSAAWVTSSSMSPSTAGLRAVCVCGGVACLWMECVLGVWGVCVDGVCVCVCVWGGGV